MKNSGFSLIELVVVIAILSTLLLIAGLSGKAWIERYRVEGQTKELYADLMNARVSAMQKNRMYFVTLASAQYTIYEDRDPAHPFSNPANAAYEGDGVFQGAAGDKLVVQKNTQYSIVSSGTNSFNFDRNGLVSMNGKLHFDLTGSTASPAYDCLKLFTTRILTGKWTNGDCVVQ